MIRTALLLSITASISLSAPAADTKAPAPEPPKPAKPQPPTRPFDAPGAPKFTRLDGKPGAVPPVDATGDFVVGPEYVAAPETKAVEGVPEGRVQQFVIESKDCKRFNPGIARDEFGKPDPNNPKTLIVETHTIDYKRTITVYVPAQYKAGTAAPLLVTHDGPGLGKPDKNLPRILDNLIAQKRIPALVMVMVQNGGGDAQGHERGREYDTLSGLFAEFIEEEVLPLVEKNCGVKITKDPEARATMGSSSGAAAAFTMAWYRPDLYRRVGLPQQAHPRERPEADPHLDVRRRPRQLQPERHARRHARLGRGKPPHGEGPEGKRLPLPIPLLPELRPRCRQCAPAGHPAGARVGVARLQGALSIHLQPV